MLFLWLFMYTLLESRYSPPLAQYSLERFSIQVANSNQNPVTKLGAQLNSIVKYDFPFT